MKRTLRNTFTTMTALLTITASQVMAMDTFIMSGRAAGMGGVGVACSTDATSQYYNPATFGFFSKKPKVTEGEEEPELSVLAKKSWGGDINAGAGARIHGEIGDYMEILANVDFEELSDNGIQNEEDIRNLVKIAKSLSGIDDEENAFSAQAAGNIASRIGHVGVGVYGMVQASGQVADLDTTNLGINAINPADLSADIETAGTDPGGAYSFQVFSTSQQNALSTGGLTDAAIRILDEMAATEGVTTEQVDQVTEILVDVTGSSGTTSTLDDNTTTILAHGFGVAEVPISYGYALNDNISIGGSIKYMKGRVYATSIRVFDDDNDEVLDEIDSNYNETSTFGVDLGIMARYGMLQLGLVGRNLNSPTFDGFVDHFTYKGTTYSSTIADVKIKPQATAGVALMPVDTLTLAVDLDLTANETNRTNYKTQFIRGGLEWEVFKFLALRAGAYYNLDESDIGLVYTAGLGLNLWGVRLDIAGTYADDTVNFDGDEVPAEANVLARLALDF